VFNAPQPRSRLYTTVPAYVKGLRAALFGAAYNGTGVERLEQALADSAPRYHVVAVPMARVGIYLDIKHLIRKGQKVILSPYTISDLVNMVLCAGGIPIFVDIEKGGIISECPRDFIGIRNEQVRANVEAIRSYLQEANTSAAALPGLQQPAPLPPEGSQSQSLLPSDEPRRTR
jgi:DegT/DnrJ/EryC1/StrS aminotransferase family